MSVSLARAYRWLIATDLDGTLLDDDYPLVAAAAAIDRVSRDHDAAVALVSSKTLPELLTLAGLCESSPFLIFENGAGLAWPSGTLPDTGHQHKNGYELRGYGMERHKLLHVLETLREAGSRFRSFADMSANEVADITGLTPEAAAQALDRAFTEPLLWQGDASGLAEFTAALRAEGLELVRGGRFHHVMTAWTKADTTLDLRARLETYQRATLPLLACGDAPNDLEMLESARCAVVFPDRKGGYLLDGSDSVLQAPAPGPAPWLRCVEALLTRTPTDQCARQSLGS